MSNIQPEAPLAEPNTRPAQDKTHEFLLAEYAALRQEILKRMETQHQVVSLSLTAFGVLGTVGFNNNISALLAYPILSLFLAMAWSQNDIRIGQIGQYICEEIEERLLDDKHGWEHWHRFSDSGLFVGRRTVRSARGTFLSTQFIALLFAVLKLNPTAPTQDLALLVIASASTLITAFVLWAPHWTTRRP